MSITIFTWGLAGGAFAHIAGALSKGLYLAGVRNISVVHLLQGPQDPAGLPPDVAVHSLGTRVRWGWTRFARYLAHARPDVVISMPAVVNMAAVLGHVLSPRNGRRLVVTEHAIMSYEAYVEQRRNPSIRALPVLARLLYPRADGVAVVSPGVLHDLVEKIGIRVNPARLRIIPNPVDIEMIREYAEEGAAAPGWRGLRPLVVSVGRLATQKNFPLLIRAFARVLTHVDAELVIMGEGHERPRLEGLIRELGVEQRVRLAGYERNPWGVMARGDLFVLPSEEEAFGLVLVEAMACGVPVVSTDALGGGPRSILEDGQHGMLVPNRDVDALAEAMREALASEGLRRRLATSGRARCEAFRPELVARQWLSFVSDLP